MSDIPARLEEAKRQCSAGEYRAAVTLLSRLALDVPGDPDILFEWGKALYLAGDCVPAADCLSRCPQTPPVRLLRAKALKGTGHFIEALEALGAPGGNAEDEQERERAEIAGEAVSEVRRFNLAGKHTEAARVARRARALLPVSDTFNANRLLSEAEIGERALIMRAAPRNLIVTLTTDCNLRCVMCEWVRAPRWELPPAALDEVRGYLPHLERVVWQGGEVFLYPGLRRLIVEAGAYPVRQVITTNGLLIDEQWAEILLGNRVDLTFSVDGITRDVYERIRKGSDFDRLLRNLTMYRRMKEQARSTVNTNLHVVVMGSNYRQLEDYVDFAGAHGFRYIAFLAIGGNHDNPENIFFRRDPAALSFLRDRLPRIHEKAAAAGILIENRLPVSWEPVPSKPAEGPRQPPAGPAAPVRDTTDQERALNCFLPWLQMYIDYDGSIRPDCVCRREGNLGSVETTSLKEAWNSSAMQQYRQGLAAGAYAGICNDECREHRVSRRYLTFS